MQVKAKGKRNDLFVKQYMALSTKRDTHDPFHLMHRLTHVMDNVIDLVLNSSCWLLAGFGCWLDHVFACCC